MTQSSITESGREDDLESKVDDALDAVEQTAEDAVDDVTDSAEDLADAGEDAIDTAEDSLTGDSDPVAIDHHDEHEGSGQGSSFYATALKLLMLVLVIFGLAMWLLPRYAHKLPVSVAKYVMPGQQVLDERLAAIEGKLDAATDEGELAKVQAEIASLTERLAAAEAAATAAQKEADAAREAAAALTAAAGSAVDEGAVAEIKESSSAAATAAETATTAATEAGKVAAAASRDAAALTRQLTSFEARIGSLTEEFGALQENLAAAPGAADGGPTPELAAAFAALKTRVDGLADRVNAPVDFVTNEDAQRFVTQDDLRSARTALGADMQASFERLPAPAEIATAKDLDSLRTAVDGKISDLASRVETAEKGAAEAAQSAASASDASTAAVDDVKLAIRDASLRAAVATLTSQMANGAAFSGALTEIEELTGKTAPEALATASAGVSTVEDLQRSFGRAAQAALGADIRADAEDEGLFSKAGAQLLSGLAGRPKSELEGDTTEALVSQIEARLSEGALDKAAATAEGLSDAAKSGMGGWLDLLKSRVAADAAAADYIASLSETQG